MATASGSFSARPFHLNLSVTTKSQNIAANTSLIHVEIWISKDSYSPSWSNNTSTWNATINGTNYSGSFTYDFRNGDYLLLFAIDYTVGHDADGGKSFTTTASSNAALLGTASAGLAYTLATIPRASTMSLSDSSINFGETTTITIARASASFTHTLVFGFGSVNTTIATKTTSTSVSYTPSMSLLSQIPSAASGWGTLTLITYSGSTETGRTTTKLTLTAPSTVVPTFSSITVSEANSAVAAAGISAYVQGISKLAYSIAGAAGIYGSTISAYKFVISGSTYSAASGTTGALSLSGSVTGTATVTDSRGRTASKTVTINVTAYAAPKLTSVSVQRANASGVASPTDGIYARANLNVSVSTLKNGSTEQNTLTYKIYARLKGATAWTSKTSVTPSGISFNSYVLTSTYAVDSSWEILVQVVDAFATSQITLQLPAATIFMHWDGQDGVGIGKFRENGALDVNGDIYNHQGSIVEPAGMVAMTATSAAPAGWLICNGGAVSRTTYAGLFAAIGTQHGAGDGSTTFNVPNLKGRTVMGVDSSDSNFNSYGEVGGAKTHTHGTTGLAAMINIVLGSDTPVQYYRKTGVDAFTTTHGAPGAAAGGHTESSGSGAGIKGDTDAGSSLPPYMALHYIIKT